MSATVVIALRAIEVAELDQLTPFPCATVNVSSRQNRSFDGMATAWQRRAQLMSFMASIANPRCCRSLKQSHADDEWPGLMWRLHCLVIQAWVTGPSTSGAKALARRLAKLTSGEINSAVTTMATVSATQSCQSLSRCKTGTACTTSISPPNAESSTTIRQCRDCGHPISAALVRTANGRTWANLSPNRSIGVAGASGRNAIVSVKRVRRQKVGRITRSPNNAKMKLWLGAEKGPNETRTKPI